MDGNPASPTDASNFSGGAPPTHAIFPPTSGGSTSAKAAQSKRRSTILVHQKSPLLMATPPQITRALAYSHPFLLPLNKLAGLLSWTTGDSWESFLLLAAFWAVVLYGDVVTRYAGPVVLVAGLILGMYFRRFSPLSSSGWSEPAREPKEANVGGTGAATGGPGATAAAAELKKKQKTGNAKSVTSGREGLGNPRAAQGHQHVGESTNTRHQKTLDEIVETLREFTARCNILLEPMLELTDFLSTQRTPTSATTRPALTTLFLRILVCTPFWVVLTLSPWSVVTTRRVVLVLGTLVLTWHARVMRVGRTVFWRSSTVRRLAALITGLTFEGPMKPSSTSSKHGTVTEAEGAAKQAAKTQGSEVTKALQRRVTNRSIGKGHDAGVKFTFIIYENQRRWLVLGWTSNLFAYERPAWTDEHNNNVPPRDDFELPEVENGSNVRWRWAEGSRWRVDGVPDDDVDVDGEAGRNGWIYYDNKVRLFPSLRVELC